MLIKPRSAMNSQDKALAKYGLYRYRIPGDGNCMFRSVAVGMKLDQETSHPVLREATVNYMQEHVENLIDAHVIDGEHEIDEIQEVGSWPGQAALIALANVLGVNIAVFYGGDKGTMDIQHFRPYSESSSGTVNLLYSFDGHYDAVVNKPNLPNPEYDLWSKVKAKQTEDSIALAKELEEQEQVKEKVRRSSEEIPPPVGFDKENVQQKRQKKYISVQNIPVNSCECINDSVAIENPVGITGQKYQKVEQTDCFDAADTQCGRRMVEIPIIRENSTENLNLQRRPLRKRLVLTTRPADHTEQSYRHMVGLGPVSTPSLFWRTPSGYYV